VKDQTHLKGNVRYVLHLLADRLGDNEYVWPSLGRLAQDGGISRSTVQDCIAYLDYAEAIDIQPRYRGDGSRSSNRYKLNVHLGVVQPRLSYSEWRAEQRTWCSPDPGASDATHAATDSEPSVGLTADPARTDSQYAELPRNSQDEHAGERANEVQQNVSGSRDRIDTLPRDSEPHVDELGGDAGVGSFSVDIDPGEPWLHQQGDRLQLAWWLDRLFTDARCLTDLQLAIEDAWNAGQTVDAVQQAMKSATGVDWSSEDLVISWSDCEEMIRQIRLL
jgi:hypothetical protein